MQWSSKEVYVLNQRFNYKKDDIFIMFAYQVPFFNQYAEGPFNSKRKVNLFSPFLKWRRKIFQNCLNCTLQCYSVHCTYLIKEEEKVVGTLRKLGELIGSDEKLEVLFTTCIMRGKSRIRRMKRKVGNKGK